jgi:VWFA-related protein
MGTKRAWAALAVVSVIGATLLAREPPRVTPASDVAIDVVVVDRSGRPVDDLQQTDFQIREDGHPATVTSFVGPAASGDDHQTLGRSIVLILDDSGITPRLTSRVQDIAKQFVSRTGVADELSVVRLSKRQDEPVGDRKESLSRIADYTAGSVPFFGRETIETALARIAKISGGFDQLKPERRIIVAIGSPNIFDIDEPFDRGASLIWPYWVHAITAAARAHVSVYVIDPTGLTGRFRSERNGVVARTGGEEFYNRNDFSAGVQQIWQDAAHYYLVGYTAPASKKELHDISVKVDRPGLQVRARRTR